MNSGFNIISTYGKLHLTMARPFGSESIWSSFALSILSTIADHLADNLRPVHGPLFSGNQSGH